MNKIDKILSVIIPLGLLILAIVMTEKAALALLQ